MTCYLMFSCTGSAFLSSIEFGGIIGSIFSGWIADKMVANVSSFETIII